jgi:hypothetical protein
MIKPRPPAGFPPPAGGKPGAGNVGNFIGAHPPGAYPSAGYRPGYGGYQKTECSDRIYRHFPYSPAYGHPFEPTWCANFHWHYTRWPYWTAPATAVSVSNYIGIGAAYTGYGYAAQVPYYPVEPAPPEVYAQSVQAPTQCVQQGQAAPVSDDSDWMNVGTFGIIPYQATDFAYAVQLATTKDGVLRGIQWDMTANTAVEIQGSIQKDTLRVAWQAKTPGALMFETNVDELTQSASMVNVYNPTTKSLVSWQLVQIDQKDLPPATK